MSAPGVVPGPERRPTAVFDLDGCLSDDEWRVGQMRDARDWDNYHRGMELDKPMNVEVFDRMRLSGHRLLFVTARPEAFRSETVYGRSIWQLDRIEVVR